MCRIYLLTDLNGSLHAQAECYEPYVLTRPPLEAHEVALDSDIGAELQEIAEALGTEFENFVASIGELGVDLLDMGINMGEQALSSPDDHVKHVAAPHTATRQHLAPTLPMLPLVPVMPENAKPQKEDLVRTPSGTQTVTLANIGEAQKKCTPSGTETATLPSSLNVGFAVISQGFDSGSGLGYLYIAGTDFPLSDEGLADMMDFMDHFVSSRNAAKGFSITYDLRMLRMPSMSMVTAVAEWGNQPERQEKWERLNTVCKVVVSSGLRYSLCQGVLTSFFFVCPPVCRTFLLTDPDEPEEHAVVFEPPSDESAKFQASDEAKEEQDEAEEEELKINEKTQPREVPLTLYEERT